MYYYTHLESREQPIRYVIDGVEECGIGRLKKKIIINSRQIKEEAIIQIRFYRFVHTVHIHTFADALEQNM